MKPRGLDACKDGKVVHGRGHRNSRVLTRQDYVYKYILMGDGTKDVTIQEVGTRSGSGTWSIPKWRVRSYQ